MGMPGSILGKLDGSHKCDWCRTNPATINMQGETDSFGYEENHICTSCHEKSKHDERERYESETFCDWCKKDKKHCTLMRDSDEGSHGPVYNVCPECRGKYQKAQMEELEYLRRQDPYYDPWA